MSEDGEKGCEDGACRNLYLGFKRTRVYSGVRIFLLYRCFVELDLVPGVWDHLIVDSLHCGSIEGCCLRPRRLTVEAKHFFSKWDVRWGRVLWVLWEGAGYTNQGILGLSNGNGVYMSRSFYLFTLDADQRFLWGFAWYVAERTQ